MWRISYLDLSNDETGQKGGFTSDKDAMEWAEKQEKEGRIVALKLLVWSELLQCCRTVQDLTK